MYFQQENKDQDSILFIENLSSQRILESNKKYLWWL